MLFDSLRNPDRRSRANYYYGQFANGAGNCNRLIGLER